VAPRSLALGELQEWHFELRDCAGLGITQKSAWFMLQRLRLALRARDFNFKLGSGEGVGVEVDETFIGGKPANMHKGRKIKIAKIQSRAAETSNTYGRAGKAAIIRHLVEYVFDWIFSLFLVPFAQPRQRS
jgi:hypothetical protein